MINEQDLFELFNLLIANDAEIIVKTNDIGRRRVERKLHELMHDLTDGEPMSAIPVRTHGDDASNLRVISSKYLNVGCVNIPAQVVIPEEFETYLDIDQYRLDKLSLDRRLAVRRAAMDNLLGTEAFKKLLGTYPESETFCGTTLSTGPFRTPIMRPDKTPRGSAKQQGPRARKQHW